MLFLCRPKFFKPLTILLISTLIAFTFVLILTQQNYINERTPPELYFNSRHVKSSGDNNNVQQSLSLDSLSLSQSQSSFRNHFFANNFLSLQNGENHQHQKVSDHRDIKTGYEIFLERPVINPHNFGFVINQPDKCKGSPVHLIITTPSAPGNFFRRMKAREVTPTNSVVRHLFFIGRTLNKDVQAKIAMEAATFKDIVQEEFIDVYKNITHKATAMLRWVAEFCPDSRYTLRLDDDVTGDLVKMTTAMRIAHEKHPHFVIGDVKVGWPPCQIPKCKTTKQEYSAATLPPFALGGALGYPTKSVIRLFEATKRVKWFKLDDVFVTGMCAPLVNVTLLRHEDFIFTHGAW